MTGEKKIKVTKNGPYLVSGAIPLHREVMIAGATGDPVEWRHTRHYPDKESYSLCRCGQSKTTPYCDGTHAQIGFDGTETAGFKKYAEQTETTTGPELDLTDAEKFCALARFCHPSGDAWNLTEQSADPAAKAMAIREACDCPSGRLVAWNKKTGAAIEPQFPPTISVTEHPGGKISGPLWVKGGVPIESADGVEYEVRNRVTLCRCGQSSNKPFCNGNHVTAGFSETV